MNSSENPIDIVSAIVAVFVPDDHHQFNLR